jgi:KDO2-lipid IV(A) lauroyltransferase
MAKLYFLPRAALKEHSRVLRLGWRIEGWLTGALLGLLARLPLARARALARRVLGALGPRTGIQTKLLRNLAILHPDESIGQLEQRARRSFGWVGVSFAEMAHLPDISRRREELIEVEADPSVEAVLRDPERAAVLVTAHVGPWTLTNLIAAKCGFPMTVIYAPESNPWIRDQILRLREYMGVNLIERDGSMRTLLRELDHGHKIGLATDVRLDGGLRVPLCGHEMETNPVPARLALRSGCPLIPIRALRLPDGRFRIIAEAAIEPDDPDADRETRVEQMTRKLSGVYGRWIRETPDDWMCMARRWPKALERERMEQARARDD